MQSDQSNDLDRVVLQANIEYHDIIASQYETDVSAAFIFTGKVQQKIESVVKLLSCRTEGKVWVDVGCGTGNVLKFAQKYFQQAVGIDVSIEMLRLAQDRKLTVSLGNVKVLPVLSGTVDVVSAFSVLHHLFDFKPALEEIHRILKPGGYFYGDLDPNGLCVFRRPMVQTVYRRILKWYVRLAYGASPSMSDQDENLARLQNLAEYHQTQVPGLDPRELVNYMQKLGFRDVAVYPSFGTLCPERITEAGVIPSKFELKIIPLFSLLGRK